MEDFKNQFELFKNKEEELKKIKSKMKQNALAHIRELVEAFDFTAEDIYKNKEPAEKIDWKTLGFEVGKNYKDGNNFYNFQAKGRKPSWLVFLAKNGTLGKDLLTTEKAPPKQPAKAPKTKQGTPTPKA